MGEGGEFDLMAAELEVMSGCPEKQQPMVKRVRQAWVPIPALPLTQCNLGHIMQTAQASHPMYKTEDTPTRRNDARVKPEDVVDIKERSVSFSHVLSFLKDLGSHPASLLCSTHELPPLELHLLSL